MPATTDHLPAGYTVDLNPPLSTVRVSGVRKRQSAAYDDVGEWVNLFVYVEAIADGCAGPGQAWLVVTTRLWESGRLAEWLKVFFSPAPMSREMELLLGIS